MRSINVSFSLNSKILVASLSLPETATIGKLKEGLKNKIFEFNIGDIIIIMEKSNGTIEILENNKTIGSITTKSELNLKALPKNLLCVFKTVDTYTQKQIDLLKPVIEVIADVTNDNPLYYLMGFQFLGKGKKKTVCKVCSYSLPLCIQTWFHDPIMLVKKCRKMNLNECDEQTITNMIENCRFANKLSLCAYSIDIWGKLAAYQFLSEKVPSITESYIRQNISRCVSPDVKASSEAEIIEKTIYHVRRHSRMDAKSARQHFFSTLLNEGCQCAFMEKVKFKVVGSLFTIRRYLYITNSKIWVTKDLSTNVLEQGKTSEIVKTFFDGDCLIIEFVTGVKWSLKSIRPKVIKSYIDDITHNAFREYQIPKSIEVSESASSKDSKSGILPNNDDEMAALAPFYKVDNDDNEEDGNYLKFSNQSVNISTYQLLNDASKERVSKMGNRVRSLKQVPSCIPKLKIPEQSSQNDVVNIKRMSMSVISIVKPVDETSNLIDEQYSMPTSEEFFQYTGYEVLMDNKALLLWICILVLLISIARYFGVGTKK
ncbi:hypothetical protein TVAG_166510 [Trichomonas vaginalis G3]|uniref:Uncharacterized protein n=1 Tax=Trichomonas vaginalis (strain ATCC PRA-98 / G3) TaxID=412133 RepID=A2DE58_TRIV3|nr:hypothetical protein TVAGG3_0174640 [Trichomonas vaginalis G3]EAY21276.1 hypothetical protein TVAG_166510 [Trichomonas vaginalis G3]KAI5548850.1 hypothetical protein TVAGG3_0174640 [Trichomonas vaginalis G3]|eukprot:XP_001582262.1 hypothetical protein [Trichomonas vaginalis G3]